MRRLLLTTTALIGLAAPAYAAPTLQVQVFDDGAQVGSTITATSGDISFTGSDANFSDIQVGGQGVPILINPDLSTTTLQATRSDTTGSHTLEVHILQDGLSPFSGALAATGTYNALVGDPGPGIENTYINGVQVDTHTMTAPVGSFGPDIISTLNAVSDEQVYLLTFDNPLDSSSATMQLLGTANTIPEPTTIALLGFGLLSLGVFSKARRPTN